MSQGGADEVIGQRNTSPVTHVEETYSRAGGREAGFVLPGGVGGQQALGAMALEVEIVNGKGKKANGERQTDGQACSVFLGWSRGGRGSVCMVQWSMVFLKTLQSPCWCSKALHLKRFHRIWSYNRPLYRKKGK
jgi:hypothetical protein